MWVDYLVPKRPEGEIGALRDENELVGRGLAYDAAVHRPETSQDAEQRGLAAAIRTHDEQVLLQHTHSTVSSIPMTRSYKEENEDSLPA